jgi:predicted ribosomally synthesized peptide with SipW-like signal peptide
MFRKLLATIAVLAAVLGLGGWATWAAFSATTTSTGNSLSLGTVAIGSNSLGAFMYDVSGAKPGDTVTRCVKTTYTGSLDADVALYVSPVGAVGDYIDLTITPGTGSPTFPGCTGFVADAGGAAYTGTLKGFADAHDTYANGWVDNPGSATKWATNDSVVYQLTLTVQDNNAANGVTSALATGTHSFTWEARNQ